jgi:hypothetical protein
MIARSPELMALCPTRIDLDAEVRAIDEEEKREARRIAAAPLPAVPPATAQALRREALARRGLTPDQIADLLTYSRARETQTGPDGHRIIRGR